MAESKTWFFCAPTTTAPYLLTQVRASDVGDVSDVDDVGDVSDYFSDVTNGSHAAT